MPQKSKVAKHPTDYFNVNPQPGSEAWDKSIEKAKTIVQDLTADIPGLGQAVGIALDPIPGSIKAIISAFDLWRQRVDDLAESMGGIEMPDISTSQLERINQLATAFEAVSGDAQKLKTELDTALEQLKFIEALKTASGQKSGPESLRAQANATADAAAKLEASAKSRLAATKKPISKEAEASILEKYKQQAQVAEKAQNEARERLRQIADYESDRDRYLSTEMPAYEVPGFLFRQQKYFNRYGYLMDPSQARKLEDGNIATQQGVIDSYKNQVNRSGERARARQTIETANQDLEEAARLRQQEAGLRRQVKVSEVAFGYDQARGIGTSNAMTVAEAAAGADIIRAGGVATAAQKEAMNKIATVFGLIGQDQKDILRILSVMNDQQESFRKALTQLEARTRHNAAP